MLVYSPISNRVFLAMTEFSIPAKLKRLFRMTLSNSWSFDKIGVDLTESIDTVPGFGQGIRFQLHRGECSAKGKSASQ